MPALTTIPLELGYKAPAFNLLDVVSNENKTFEDLKGEKATVVMFICNHCPFVKHINGQLAQLAKDYQAKGVGFIAISSNDAERYIGDAPDRLKAQAVDNDFSFAYLYDETQEVAQAYKAVCTPDFSIFDGGDLCVYRGQLDSSRPGNGQPVDGKDMRAALDAILSGDPIAEPQRPSMGCSIKWKGEAPY